ncbi:PAS domain S-box-containing protein/diguanylate cyclase (GGDEF) domain-containing protein [Marinospirillum celere]|uniref:cyclic-guanylate-specific phosphodiesterase n=1 Tax=Marinospirillum celere TaxID=1122252 RepID=A0A1I1GSX1_9GAMM|nr:EAL domain-containing protein [Marinospirillum celere]SFC12130.1 PAS domain S-box-containing protein/diguanylate cyclase (GGDEF) domain-containing protein [Marinospirillum celere]
MKLPGHRSLAKLSPVLKVAGIYAVVSALWIIYSDAFIDSLNLDPSTLTQLQTRKGLIFISLSSLLIAWLVYRALKVQDKLIKRLMKTSQQLQQAGVFYEATNEGLLLLDTRRRIQSMNPAAQTILGYREGDLKGRRLSLLVNCDQTSAFYREIWKQLLRLGHWQGRIQERRKDGSHCHLWVTINRIEGDGDNRYLVVFADVSQLEESNTRLQRLVHYDPLTDLPNRSFISLQLENAMIRAGRWNRKVGALLLDLDGFKTLNDSLGHQAGDELIIAVARRLQNHFGDKCLLARLGGDEFLLTLEQMHNSNELYQLAAQVLDVIKEPFELASSQQIWMTASIGTSIYPEDAGNPEELLRNADAALYKAKDSGRNTYSSYSQELTEKAQQYLSMEARLRKALSNDELRVHYQPLIDLQTGECKGVEALMRWQDPDAGLIPPMEFIPHAEQSGLIGALGEWVLSQSIKDFQGWLDLGIDPGILAVNLSPRQFAEPQLVSQIAGVLKSTQFPAERLELEITETALISRGDQAESDLRRLKSLGLALAIDDFGTGYSSLAYLKQLPIDKLKVDRSFIKDLPSDVTGGEIVAAIIAMGKAMDLEVLAEGIETRAQQEFLTNQGCPTAQGYWFSRPLPADQLLLWLKNNQQTTLPQPL